MPLFGSNYPPNRPYSGPPPGIRPPNSPQKNGGVGGLINKLLGSKQDNRPSQGPPTNFGGNGFQGGPGHFPQGPQNEAKWLGMMKNAQKGLSIIETVGPLIQQYGPIVKNLPSILSMLKEIQKDEGETENVTNSSDSKLEDQPQDSLENFQPKSKAKQKATIEPPHTKATTDIKKRETKKSVPKLYI